MPTRNSYKRPRLFPTEALFSGVHTPEDRIERSKQLGIHRDTGVRWAAGGIKLSFLMADRYAVRLNKHPCEVWGDLWWESIR